MLRIVLFLLLTSALVHASSDPCSDGTYKEDEKYGIEGQCSSSYYQCVHGASKPMQCPPGTVWNNKIENCDWSDKVDACSSDNLVDCKDSAGNPATTGGYTKPGDCKGGTYYVCINGEEKTETCGDGLIYDPDAQICDWAANQQDCDVEKPAAPVATTTTKAAPGNTTTTATTTTSTAASGTGSNTTDPVLASTTTTSTKTPATPDPCSDGTYDKDEEYGIEDQCSSGYYRCIDGVSTPMQCSPGTVWNNKIGKCDWSYNVDACSSDNLVDCKDAAGNPATTGGYTKPGDCKDGVYYVCINGEEKNKTCGDGLIYDSDTQVCDWNVNQQDCDVEKPDAPVKTTTEKTTTTTAPGGASNKTTTTPPTTTMTSTIGTDAITHDPSFTSTSTTEKTTTEILEDSNTTDPIFASTTTTTPKTPTTTTTTTETTTTGPLPTFVGFVVDDTGSMYTEIVTVKEWIKDCVDGTSSSCANPPTGGWVMTSFNDPYVGKVIGPTHDVNEIIDEVGDYHANGGGDCPELGFTGLENAVNVIPAVNGGCKIFFFTDATAKDYTKADAVTSLYKTKGCSFVPILTGCCGTCPAVCDTVDPDYYLTHVTDKTDYDTSCSTGIARSVKASVQTQFYTMAEETGGSIYVTEKPSSSDEMLDFLEDEVTLGFCESSTVAGPAPDGYKCEEDCTAMGMCWDKSVSKCYCNGTLCTNTPIYGYSQCAGEQVVVCDPNVVIEIIPEQKNCTGYFKCHSGELYHYNCAPGSIYSADSTSHCDHPENVPPPCGEKTGDDDGTM